MDNIQMWDVNMLHPHPKNPRQELGDLTELTASVKESGVLQALVLVPDLDGRPDHATILLGHRRYAAAVAAGLSVVPAILKPAMSESEQIALMLTENINRKKLQAHEEAAGYQMMIDLGESTATVAKMSGISEGTVRNRIKLLSLPVDGLKAAEEAGASLFQIDAVVTQLTNPDLRAKALAAAGTKDFNATLKSCVEREKLGVKWSAALQCYDLFALRVDDKPANAVCVDQKMSPPSPRKIKTPEDAAPVSGDVPEGKVRYYYRYMESEYYSSMYLYRDKTPADTTADEAKRLQTAWKDQVISEKDALEKLAKQLRADYVRKVSKKAVKSVFPEIVEVLAKASYISSAMYGSRMFPNTSVANELFDVQTRCSYTDAPAELLSYATQNPELTLFRMAYLVLENKSYCGTRYGDFVNEEFPFIGIVKEDAPNLDMLYSILKKTGYQMSDVELQLMDGTHPIYSKRYDPSAESAAVSSVDPSVADTPSEVQPIPEEAANETAVTSALAPVSGTLGDGGNGDICITTAPAAGMPSVWEGECLMLAGNSAFLHVQTSGSGNAATYAYSLYDGETLLLDDGGEFTIDNDSSTAVTMEDVLTTACNIADVDYSTLSPAPEDMLDKIIRANEGFNDTPTVDRSIAAEDVDYLFSRGCFMDMRFPLMKLYQENKSAVEICHALRTSLGYSGGRCNLEDGAVVWVSSSAQGLTLQMLSGSLPQTVFEWKEVEKRLRALYESNCLVTANDVPEYQAWAETYAVA